MKTVVGFTFTEIPLFNLIERGFLFHRSDDSLSEGFRRFSCPLEDSRNEFAGFEIHEILDESVYLASRHAKSFSPYILEISTPSPAITQPNSLRSFRGIVNLSDIQEADLKIYFELRKPTSLCALWLNCTDMNLFLKKALPEKVFEWNHKKTALIHLGPNCFDLLVTEN